MGRNYVSNHSRGPQAGPPRVRHHTQWLLSIKVYRPGSTRNDLLAGKILTQAAACILCNGTFKPALGTLAEAHGVCVRSVSRSVQALKLGGFVTIRRRGRKLSNVYRLAKWLWCRLTGRYGSEGPWLPGMAPLLPGIQAALDRARASWAAARREVVPATR